jgi:hypothetical protein
MADDCRGPIGAIREEGTIGPVGGNEDTVEAGL